MKIKGDQITLKPIKLNEKDEFYKLATESYGSQFWYDVRTKKSKTREEFFRDWHDGYFDSNCPEKGQCFWIEVKARKIGQVNYNKIDLKNKKVEIDIIIGAKKDMGKGYGPDALKALIKYLFENFNLNKIWISARVNNPRAIRAYQKIGFKTEGVLREEDYFQGKFIDCVRFGILRKELQ